MGKIIVLGSANAVPDAQHANTHLLLLAGERTVLIDCTGNSQERFARAGVDPLQLTDILMTHFHPDHVSGIPGLLLDLWLLGRKAPLHLYGLQDTVLRMKGMLDLYQWDTFPNFYPLEFHVLPDVERTLVLQDSDLRISASPVQHMIPTLGLRFEFLGSGKCAAYSCDTEPCASVVHLAQDADLLIHEATGPFKGHTSPRQAGEIAAQASAAALVLIHYPPQDPALNTFVNQAQQTYAGPVSLAQDFMQFDL